MFKILHFFSEGLRMSWHAIKSYRLRTLLTMLGISIGIFAITTIFTLVNTLEKTITKNLAELGNTVLFVHNWPWADNGNDWYKYIGRPKVDYNDYKRLRQGLSNVEAVYLEASKGGETIKAGRQSLSGLQVLSVTDGYDVVANVKVEEGRYFSIVETEAGRSVAVIGHTVAKELFGGSMQAVNQTMRIGTKQVRVIGVMEKEGDNPFGGSDDERVIIPYALGARMYNFDSRRVDRVIGIKAADYQFLTDVEDQTIGLVRQARGLTPRQENNFSINKQEMLMERVGMFMGNLQVGGFIISIFSLLVGGFGIANIMFVSVKERTREIGIQKSLGATRNFIMSQFLTEAVILCIGGGLIGILFMFGVAGAAQAIVASMEANVEIAISLYHLGLGIGISAGIGLLSGFIPAAQAARLDPVVAMRQ